MSGGAEEGEGAGEGGGRQETLRTGHVDAAISRRFRELREALRLTRTQVAADMGASVSRWQAYENGKRIPASRIWQFCSRYGIDVGDLYAGLPFTIGPVEPGAPGETANGVAARGMAEDGAVFEDGARTAGSPSSHPSADDEVLRAIRAAAADLSPLERRLALAALRGMVAKS